MNILNADSFVVGSPKVAWLRYLKKETFTKASYSIDENCLSKDGLFALSCKVTCFGTQPLNELPQRIDIDLSDVILAMDLSLTKTV